MEKIKREKIIDSVALQKKVGRTFDLSLARFARKHKNTSVYLSPRGHTDRYLTSTYQLYFEKKNNRAFFSSTSFDCARGWSRQEAISFVGAMEPFDLYGEIKDRYSELGNYVSDLISGSIQGVSPARMWNLSIVSSIIFGMFLMTMMYRYLGQGASAKDGELVVLRGPSAIETTLSKTNNGDGSVVLGEADEKLEEEKSNIFPGSERNAMKEKIRDLAKGYPIEKMAEEIAQKDPKVAAFVVSIAKKESDWGKRVPALSGVDDCFNYWGFKLQREKMGTGGHTCFDSRKDAVDAVSKRIEQLVYEEKIDTPEEMAVAWKCGYDCSWDDPKNVKKWVSDVDRYYKQLAPRKNDSRR